MSFRAIQTLCEMGSHWAKSKVLAGWHSHLDAVGVFLPYLASIGHSYFMPSFPLFKSSYVVFLCCITSVVNFFL